MVTNADRTEAAALVFADTVREDDRLQAVAAAHRIIEYCKPPKR